MVDDSCRLYLRLFGGRGLAGNGESMAAARAADAAFAFYRRYRRRLGADGALGILGSVVAGFLGQQLGWYRIGEPAGFIASVFGALLIMAVVGGMRR